MTTMVLKIVVSIYCFMHEIMNLPQLYSALTTIIHASERV